MEEQIIQMIGNFTALAISLYWVRVSERRIDRYEERLFVKQAKLDDKKIDDEL